MFIVLRPNLEHSLHHLQILTEPFNQICGRFYFYFIASPVGFIKFAFKLKAIYQCGLTLNWNITTVRIVSKIFYLVFPDVFNMLRLVYFMTKSICYLTKGLESWVPNIRIYYEIFQVLSTKDGVKKNYSTVGFGHWMRGTLVLLLGTSWCRRSFNFLWKLQGV